MMFPAQVVPGPATPIISACERDVAFLFRYICRGAYNGHGCSNGACDGESPGYGRGFSLLNFLLLAVQA
jgi:hypothetical protein